MNREDFKNIDAKDVRWRDLIVLIFNKLTIGTKDIWKSPTFVTLVVLTVFYFSINTYFTIDKKTVEIPGRFINISEFTKLGDSDDLVNGLSVKQFTRDNVIDHLALVLLFWKEYKYLEEVTFTESNDAPKLNIGDELYDMQISAYLTVKEYIGKPKEYTQKIIITKSTVISDLAPNVLPADEIISIDGVLVNDNIDVEIAKLARKVHTLVVKRGEEIFKVKSDLYGVDARKVISLTNLEDYKEFNDFAKLGVEGYLGRSAGSALALEYYNKTVRDVAKDRKVALTGTINETGKIGFITGIKQKTVLAIQNDVDIMFVPKDNNITKNYSDAVAVAKDLDSDMKIVVMDNFSDVIDYLNAK
jgi:PDZ domain-containing secreted protein